MSVTNQQLNQSEYSIKEYLNLIRNNLLPFSIITLTCIIVSVIYAVTATDIYRSTTTLKLSKPQGNILNAPLLPEFQEFGSDRFIANEIEVLKSYTVRNRTANALLDTFNVINDPSRFSMLLISTFDFDNKKPEIISVDGLTGKLFNVVKVEQKRGLDIVEISVESPSSFEAALIANLYADVYLKLNLEFNRNQLTLVKMFLNQQKTEKLVELNDAEELLRNYQEKGGIIALEQQANTLIGQLSSFEASKNVAKIELAASKEALASLKNELKKQDPELTYYLEKVASEEYLKSLQVELAKLEVNRDLALANAKDKPIDPKVLQNYDNKMNELKSKLDEKINVVKASILSSSPADVRALMNKIIEAEIKNQSLAISISQYQDIINQYELKFNRLPKSSIELARLQRNRESLEKLYVLVEQKYQEALINEQSQPGNVLIIDTARIPNLPSKPNRMLIVLIGIVLGFGFAFGFTILKSYLDNTVKTPEDIQNKNINVLGWIPVIDPFGENGSKEHEFIFKSKPDSIPSEAFRALRTKIQFSNVDGKEIKSILITSSAPSEGKTLIVSNLAASIAQTNKKVLLIDCDLRKPRIHSFFSKTRIPGLVDYLFNKVELKDIIHSTPVNDLYIISSGTIPPNPSETLGSQKMKDFLDMVHEEYDFILIDSPPIIAVTDAEILARMVDGVILVVSANTTENELMVKSVEIINQENVNFLGTVLNNFVYRSSYGSYYKYYYYYRGAKDTKRISQKS